MDQNKERIHILVFGRVQRVGFRSFVLDQAHRLTLTGWVRNLAYDQVECLAEGTHPNLENFLAAIRQGPTGARVDETQVEWLPASGEFNTFEMRSSR